MTASGPVHEEERLLGAVDDVAERLGTGEPLFGRPLLVLRSGPVPVRGSAGAVLALDPAGVAVLVVVLEAAVAGTGADVADELDRLATCGTRDRAGPGLGEDLAVARARSPSLPERGRPAAGVEPLAVLVVRAAPDRHAWEELVVELGEQLLGVHVLHPDGRTSPLALPEELQRRRRRRAPLVPAALVGAAALLLATLVVLRLDGSDDVRLASAPSARASVHQVAAEVAAGSTHNGWIGQTHVVRASDGTLLVVCATAEGLQVVADHADQGRQWRAPVPLGVRATSSSVVIDAADRLHVAFSDGSRVAYTVLTGSGGTWTGGRPVEVDAGTSTPYVDVAYDEATRVAHVVWAQTGPDGQVPAWAAVSAGDGQPRVLETEPLAPPGRDVPVLVNVAANQGGPVLASYRRGDRVAGWASRTLTTGAAGATWEAEQRVPTDAGIGAASLAVDRWGTAHLVLRDSTTFALRYFSLPPGGPWSGEEIAVDAEATSEIDLPSLSVDRSSRLVHLFFHSDRAQRAPGVQVAVRHPVGGWGSPSPVVPAEVLGDGAFFPTSMSDADGVPFVLWTTGGDRPALQAASVAP